MSNKSPLPTYQRIEIRLRQPPGLSVPIPPYLYFDMDTRLDEGRFREVLTTFIGIWEEHYIETHTNGASDIALCTEKYATKELAPVWLNHENKKLITGGKKALEFAMDTITRAFIQNGTWSAPVAKIDYSSSGTICSEEGRDIHHIPLDFKINPVRLLRETNGSMVGSLLHAWLHKIGYRHPKGIYTNYFMAEAPICLMRFSEDKAPGQSDSVYTQFFDCPNCNDKRC